MFPGLTTRSKTDGGPSDVESLSQIQKRGWRCFVALSSDDADCFIGKLGKVLGLTLSFVAAFLLVHIFHVSPVIAQEEVGRSDTSSVVTVVKNEFVFWNNAILQFPCDTMSGEDSMCFACCISCRPQCPITMRGEGAGPFPTAGRHVRDLWTIEVNESPELFWRRFPVSFGCTTRHKECVTQI